MEAWRCELMKQRFALFQAKARIALLEVLCYQMYFNSCLLSAQGRHGLMVCMEKVDANGRHVKDGTLYVCNFTVLPLSKVPEKQWALIRQAKRRVPDWCRIVRRARFVHWPDQ